jgi:hypothetical protein
MFIEKDIDYVLTSNVVDDTNMRFAGVESFDKASCVMTIMHNVQKVVIAYTDDAAGNGRSAAGAFPHKVFQLHQPSIVVRDPRAPDLLCAFLSWILVSFKGAGRRWFDLKLPDNLFNRVKMSVWFFVADSLKANDTVFGYIRQLLTHLRRKAAGGPKFTALQVRCLIHQVNLTRRPLALCFDGFWSTLVRLGHLFESSSFKESFKDSLAAVVSEMFRYLPVEQLPQDAIESRRKAIVLFRRWYNVQLLNNCDQNSTRATFVSVFADRVFIEHLTMLSLPSSIGYMNITCRQRQLVVNVFVFHMFPVSHLVV